MSTPQPAVALPTLSYVTRRRGQAESSPSRTRSRSKRAAVTRTLSNATTQQTTLDQRAEFDSNLGYAHHQRKIRDEEDKKWIPGLDRLWKFVDSVSDALDRRIVATSEAFDHKFFGFMFKTVSNMTVQAAATPHMPKRVRDFVVPQVHSDVLPHLLERSDCCRRR